MKIDKKIPSTYFNLILAAKKSYDFRLADFECKEGDMLVLHELDDRTKEPTGRVIEKEVTYVERTKGSNVYSKEDIENNGYQIIAFRDILPQLSIDSIVFYTNDIEKTKDFYINTLGFTLDYQQGDKYISFLLPDNTKLGIKKATEEREIPGHQTIFINALHIEDFYEYITTKGITIHKPLTNESWGINFSILDPDGNKIQFVKRLN